MNDLISASVFIAVRAVLSDILKMHGMQSGHIFITNPSRIDTFVIVSQYLLIRYHSILSMYSMFGYKADTFALIINGMDRDFTYARRPSISVDRHYSPRLCHLWAEPFHHPPSPFSASFCPGMGSQSSYPSLSRRHSFWCQGPSTTRKLYYMHELGLVLFVDYFPFVKPAGQMKSISEVVLRDCRGGSKRFLCF